LSEPVWAPSGPAFHDYRSRPRNAQVHVPRFTLHASRFTLHASRFTLHASRFTLHASRFTRTRTRTPTRRPSLPRRPGLAEKGDVSDWIAAGGTAEALLALVEAAPARPAAVVEDVSEQKPKRPLTSRSYFSIVTIIEDNRRNVLEGRRLGLNEMTGKPTLGGAQVRDEDVFRIRYLVEGRFEGDGRHPG
jgi:hypothetical protein